MVKGKKKKVKKKQDKQEKPLTPEEKASLEAKMVTMQSRAQREVDGRAATKEERQAELPFNPIIQYLLKTFLFTEKEFFEQRGVPWGVIKKMKWEKIIEFTIAAFDGYNHPRDLGKMKISPGGAGIAPFMNKFTRLRCGVDMDLYPEYDDGLFVPMNILNTFKTMLSHRLKDFATAICAKFKLEAADPVILKIINTPNFLMKRFCMARPVGVPIYAASGMDMLEMVFDSITKKGRKGDYTDKNTHEYQPALMKKMLPELRTGFFDIPMSIIDKAFSKIGPFRLMLDDGAVYFVRREIIGSSFEVEADSDSDESGNKQLGPHSKEDFRFANSWAITVMSDSIPEYSMSIDMPTHFKGTFRDIWTMYATINGKQTTIQTDGYEKKEQGPGKLILGITPEMIHMLKTVLFVALAVEDPDTIVSDYPEDTEGGSLFDYLETCNCADKLMHIGAPVRHALLENMIRKDRPSWYYETPDDMRYSCATYINEE